MTRVSLDRDAMTPDVVLDAARRLAPTIAARSGEIEAARRVPRDLLDELRAAGCFRMLLPRSHGGLGADVASTMRTFETLARADASTAWTVMITSGAWFDLVGLPRATFDALFAEGPDVLMAGVFSPTGSMTTVDGGYRVDGRWAFASGCQDARWLFGNCIDSFVDGVPQLRVALFEPDQVEIEDTWTVSGLSGSGSHHFRAEQVMVPVERTSPVPPVRPCLDDVVVNIPAPSLFAIQIATVALGIARGSLDDIVDLATNKTPLFAPASLAASPTFQADLAVADTELRAARALLYETAEAMWAAARVAQPFTLEELARIRSAAAWATERAAAVVGAAYRAGGGTSLYATSPLQRRLRDINAVTQHFLVKHDTFTTAGAILAGQEVDVVVF